MKFTASTVLGGLLLAGSLSVAQAQTTTTPTPVAPDSKPTHVTPKPGDPIGANTPQRAGDSAGSVTGNKPIAEQTMGDDHLMTKREADAAYADAKRQCKNLSGQERAGCMQQAHDDYKRWTDVHKDSRKDDIRNPDSTQELPQSGTR